MKRPLGVSVLAVCAVLVALLYVVRIGLDVVGADMDLLVFSLVGSAVFAVLFLLVGLGFLAGQAWSWMLALLLIGWHVALRVFDFLVSMLDGGLSFGWLIAVTSGVLVVIAVGAIIGFYLARERVQRYFNVRLRGNAIVGIVAAAAVVAVVMRGVPYLSI